MTRLSVATWNINSVRLRAGLVQRFVEQHRPDVLCLQEIKCRNGEFPTAAFTEMGLPYLHIRGQKGWHGVAIGWVAARKGGATALVLARGGEWRASAR